MEAIADRLLGDPGFRAEVHRLRLSLGAEGEGPLASGTNLTAAGNHLSGKFALGRNWRGWLMFCLGRGIEGVMGVRALRPPPVERIRLDVRDRDDGVDPVITLTIYAETTLEDVKLLWPQVQYEQDLLPSYRESRERAKPPNAERNAYIVQLYEQGLDVSEIVERCEERGWDDVHQFAVYGVLRRNRP